MKTDIKSLLEIQYGTVLAKSDRETYTIRNLVYDSESRRRASKRKDSYADFFQTMREKIDKIIKDSESEWNTGMPIRGENKAGIAAAILAMRGELLDNAQYSGMERAYREGYSISESVMGEKISAEEKNDREQIRVLKEEFEGDIDRFTVDLSERLDKVISKYEDAEKRGDLWKWAVLTTALFAAVNAMEYRLGMIAVEPFRRAYRAGAIHGIKKILGKRNIKLSKTKWVWGAIGENPCPRCAALDGQVVSAKEAEMFLHPNCQCALTLIVG